MVERWRVSTAGVGIVIAMHMVSRTIKRNSHGALEKGEEEEWDFRVGFNRDGGESESESEREREREKKGEGGRTVRRKRLPRPSHPPAGHGLLSQFPSFGRRPPPRGFLSPTPDISIPYSPALYTSARRI